MNETRQLSEFISDLKFGELPSEVVDYCKAIVMDTLGCAIAVGKIDTQKAGIALNIARQFEAKPEASVIKGGFKTHAGLAAMANSLLAHSLDFDDTHKGALTHTGAIVVPTSLALAEAKRVSGKDFITAVVAGFEVCVRVGMCVMPSHYQYWHSTATNGTFGGGASAAKIMELDVNETQNCLGMCGTQAAGLVTFFEYGDYTKTLHAGKASFNGIISAQLAETGATGPPTILEHEKGYARAFSQEPKIEKLIDGLGTKWEILLSAIKPYPSILASHSPIEATLSCMRKNRIKPEMIKKITNQTYNTVKTHFSNYEIGESVMAARLSVPYCIAVAAADGQVANEQFTSERLKDEKLLQLMQNVEVIPDTSFTRMYPEKFPAQITIYLHDGRQFEETVYYPKGDLNNPFTFKELEEKFGLNVAGQLTDTQIKDLLEEIYNLEDLKSLDRIVSLII